MDETSNHSISAFHSKNDKERQDHTEQTFEESAFLLDFSHHRAAQLPQQHEVNHDCFLLPFLSNFLGLFFRTSHEHPRAFEPVLTASYSNADTEYKKGDAHLRLSLNDKYDNSFHSLDFSETSVADDSSSLSCSTIGYDFQEQHSNHDEDDGRHGVHQLKDFERHRILGAGQFGQVWLVSEKKSTEKTAFALKVHSKYDLITAGEVDTIIREKKIMQMLQHHPFIVQLHASFQDENLVYMLQDFCQGGELFSVMHNAGNNGSLPEHQAAFYTLCIADALHHMHSAPNNIVYRDLKPENIMLDRQGYPKLIDMGYAKVLTADTDYKTFTFCGTPRYAAPETVASSGCSSSFGVDNWALGVLVYEMLLGESPFYWEGIDEASLFVSIAEDDYPAVSSPEATVSADAVDLIAGLLIKDPSQRLGVSDNDICQHAWLRSMDLAAMRRKQVPAPWVPNVHSVLDAGCFDDWDELDDRITQNHPKLMTKEAALFDAF